MKSQAPMDYSADYQQQTYDPSSQSQAYDQYAQAYYAYHQYANQQHPYYGYTQHQQQGEPTPPGVTAPQHVTQQATEQAQNSYYYPQPVASNMDPQQGGNAYGGVYGVGAMPTVHHQPIAQSTYGSTGIVDGGSSRGAQAQFGPKPNVAGRPFRGRGRGRGRGKHVSVASTPVVGEGHPQPVRPPPQMAWCELCRVDCNTAEILEQHRNGKKHKKNMKVYEELQRLNKDLTGGQNDQPLTFGLKQEDTSQPVENDNLTSQAGGEENIAATENQNVEDGEPNKELGQNPRMNHYEGRGRGFKRSMRGGGRGGGKWVRSNDGSKKPAESPTPKGFVPLICELCNVKCESVITFQGHLVGKRHQSNAKRFQGHQDIIGQAALQALFPALQALYPQLQALIQQNASASNSVTPQIHPQGFVGPEANLVNSGWTQGQTSTATETQQDLHSSNPQVLASETATQNASNPTENVAAGTELLSPGKHTE